MVTMVHGLKRTIWHASGSTVGGIRQFTAPVAVQINWRGLSTSAEMEAFGPEYMDYRQAVATNDVVSTFKRFDRVWMDTSPSATFDPLARDADFYVVGATQGAAGIGQLLFKRLSSDGD